jgi:excisionase family DNA binding protein
MGENFHTVSGIYWINNIREGGEFNMNKEELLTVRETAEILGITPQGVYSLIRRNKLQTWKPDGDANIFIPKAEIEKFLYTHKKCVYENGKIRYFKVF